MTGDDTVRNRLATSTSPYLRQHASNPVDWYEWGPEALDRAKTEDKPILLSVGYSACHWCHVMAHESFEDPAIAALMNEWFVNIKVDREERPDVDAIYQRVVQLMGEGGGWPLTVFLTPEQRPFYGGTYFPPQSKYGRPGFSQVLRALAELYRDDRAKIEDQVAAFRDGFARLATLVDEAAEAAHGDPDVADPRALRVATQRLLTKVDPEFGGFGRAPKFPNPTALEVLAAAARAGDEGWCEDAKGALRSALTHMARGGIYDHLRGGFARYSTDRVWLVPHFEKMLYDNAQLLPLYAEAGAAEDWRVVTETVEYLAADMRTDEGTFYAATDADSEGVEGKYFVWTPSELKAQLGDGAERFAKIYGVTDDGNFEHGWSILHLPRSVAERADELHVEVDALQRELDDARAELLKHRSTRVPPHRDDKVLTAWNALLVSGLCRTASAAAAAGRDALATRCDALARDCLDHLLAHHVRADGAVLRAAFEGRVHTRGYLDDVAFLARACLDLHERTLAADHLDAAARLAEHAVDHYARRGADETAIDGFFLSADDGEHLIERTESTHDGPIPSGLGVMVEVLARLDAAERAPADATAIIDAVCKRFVGALVQPLGYASLLTAARHLHPEATHVTLTGAPGDPGVREMAAVVGRARLGSPAPVTLACTPGHTPAAIVCRRRVCTAPLPDATALAADLRVER